MSSDFSRRKNISREETAEREKAEAAAREAEIMAELGIKPDEADAIRRTPPPSPVPRPAGKLGRFATPCRTADDPRMRPIRAQHAAMLGILACAIESGGDVPVVLTSAIDDKTGEPVIAVQVQIPFEIPQCCPKHGTSPKGSLIPLAIMTLDDLRDRLILKENPDTAPPPDDDE